MFGPGVGGAATHMHPKSTLKIDDETGMRIGLAGLFVALVGTVLAFTVFPTGGYWIGVIGGLLGLLGMIIHFAKNWRSIFRVDQ